MVTHEASSQAAQAIEDGNASTVDSLVIANGSLTSRNVLGPFVHGLIDVAEKNGRALEITTYDDPFTGSSAYGQSYRTERYLRVIRHVRDTRQPDPESPLFLAGQSRGWLTVVQAAEEVVGQQKLGGITGIAPVGHTPMDITVCPKDVAHVLALTAAELLDKRTVFRFGHYARAAKLAMAHNAVSHTIGNAIGDWPPAQALRAASLPLFAEAQEILTTDVTKNVVGLSQQLGHAVVLAACKYDTYAPGQKVIDRIMAEPGFAGRAIIMDTAHNGPLLDRRLILPLYELLVPERPISDS